MTRTLTAPPVLDRSSVVMGRFAELDGLRGLAAMAVVIGHFAMNFGDYYPGHAPSPIFFPYGAYGVQLFFMISGFVILLSAVRGGSAKHFAISRFTRLYPTYWAALAIAVAIFVLYGVETRTISLVQVLANTTMLQRFMMIESVDEVYWTLAVELQFYLLVFIALIVCRGRITVRLVRNATIVWLAIAVAVSIAVYAAGGYREVDAGGAPLVKLATWILLGEHAPLFCTGVLAFISVVTKRIEPLLPVAAAAAVLTAWLQHGMTSAVPVAIVVAIFLAVVAVRRVPFLARGPIQFLGTISYPLYVLHVLPGFLIIDLTIDALGPWWSRILALAVVIALAWLVHITVETRVSAWLRRVLMQRFAPRAGTSSLTEASS